MQDADRTIDFRFAQEELMMKEFSNDPISETIRAVEKQYEVDKQEKQHEIDKQENQYEVDKQENQYEIDKKDEETKQYEVDKQEKQYEVDKQEKQYEVDKQLRDKMGCRETVRQKQYEVDKQEKQYKVISKYEVDRQAKQYEIDKQAKKKQYEVDMQGEVDIKDNKGCRETMNDIRDKYKLQRNSMRLISKRSIIRVDRQEKQYETIRAMSDIRDNTGFRKKIYEVDKQEKMYEVDKQGKKYEVDKQEKQYEVDKQEKQYEVDKQKKQYEVDKQDETRRRMMRLLIRMYERQMQQLRFQLMSPGTPSLPFPPEDIRLIPSGAQSAIQRKYQQWAQDR
ncbi:hypothetical protein DPMN_069970 [Dreissena polymorpha]|uniref:Uncharacterized protein n=1 Tax=Dreissena polymorpha TaxID=45954 RepID=A0A9D3Z492_DREPO|nr:hypothetical protein DPMN_069970 [Dreissena polymorpha]